MGISRTGLKGRAALPGRRNGAEKSSVREKPKIREELKRVATTVRLWGGALQDQMADVGEAVVLRERCAVLASHVRRLIDEKDLLTLQNRMLVEELRQANREISLLKPYFGAK